MSSALPVLETHALRKSFHVHGAAVDAVRGVDLAVAPGEIFAFLGPNGAGKTTTVRMLATLLTIDRGRALIAGIDVAKDPQRIRQVIGYVGQLGGADPPATGRENLLLQGELYGMSHRGATARAEELIDALALGEFIDRRVSTFSGGQRRRLEVALGIVHRPEVLFLDEPTTGLDPQNRANLWDQLRGLRESGTTIFLTTHYLEEADALADRLAIIDHGQIVAEGTSHELKQQLAGETLVLKAKRDDVSLDALRSGLAAQGYVRNVSLDGETMRLSVKDGIHTLPLIFELLARHGIELEAISLSEPSLDDVFLLKTGRSLRDASPAQPDGSR